MDIYTTEEEQAEVIKKWIKDNGAAVIIGIILGLGGLKGWDYWKESKLENAAVASAEYEAILPLMNKSSLAEMDSRVTAFASRNDNNVYYDFLQLRLAKKAITDNNLSVAETALKNVVGKSVNEVVENIATLRLARVYIAQKKPQQALDLLNKEVDTFKILFSEVRGDAYLSLGENAKAKLAYVNAQENFSGNGQDMALQMKINDLTVADVVEEPSTKITPSVIKTPAPEKSDIPETATKNNQEVNKG